MAISDLNIFETEGLKKDYVMPAGILWHSEGVSNEAVLLQNRSNQPKNRKVALFDSTNGKKAAILFDFGTEFSGGVRIATQLISKDGIPHVPGVKMRIRFGESVAEALTPVGVKNSKNAHTPRDFDVRLLYYGCTEWGQTGYRFLYLELETEDVEVEIGAVHGIFTYRDIPYIGKFECDDPVFTDIYKTCAYTVHLNMQNMLWDGIKRDRMVWIGDMHPEVRVIRSVFGDNPVVDESMKSVIESYPLPEWPNEIATYGMWFIYILYDWYVYNGRKEFLLEIKNYWTGLLKQLADLVHTDGIPVREEELNRGFFFDWPTREMPEAAGAGVHALLANVLKMGARLCEVLEQTQLASECRIKAGYLKNHNLYHNNMKQIVAMMCLAGHISSEEATRVLTDGCGRGLSTFQSFYIFKAVAQSAGNEQALKILKHYYGGMLNAGATTFWEDFDVDWIREGARIDQILKPGEYDIHGDNGKFCYTGLRHSLCHGWSAGPAAFLAEDVLGVQIQSPGCKQMTVKPELGILDWVKGSYPTPYGEIRVEAERVRGTVQTKIEAPKQIEIM